jgi:hypothetical protein
LASRRCCQGKEFFREAQDHFNAVAHGQFTVESLEMGVDGVWRNAEIGSDGKFSAVIEHASHDLQFTPGQFQCTGDLRPSLFTEYL